MRRLFLLRHAKSSWAEPLPDRERPLAARGRRAAPAMAEHMRDEGWVPDRVLCSPAARTRETWFLSAPILGDPPVDYPEPLYFGAEGEVLELLAGIGRDTTRVLVIGHNPGLQGLALTLAGDGDAVLRARLAGKFPTCALAVIDLDIPGWGDVDSGVGTLAAYARPKDLPGADRLRL